MTPQDRERAAFEASYKPVLIADFSRDWKGDYRHASVQSGWDVWQAARALPPEEAAVPSGWQPMETARKWNRKTKRYEPKEAESGITGGVTR